MALCLDRSSGCLFDCGLLPRQRSGAGTASDQRSAQSRVWDDEPVRRLGECGFHHLDFLADLLVERLARAARGCDGADLRCDVLFRNVFHLNWMVFLQRCTRTGESIWCCQEDNGLLDIHLPDSCYKKSIQNRCPIFHTVRVTASMSMGMFIQAHSSS